MTNKETKSAPRRSGSPLRDLEPESLKALVKWGSEDSYKVLRNVIRAGELKKMERLIQNEEFNETFLPRLNRLKGEIEGIDQILRIPQTAKKLLEKAEKTN